MFVSGGIKVNDTARPAVPTKANLPRHGFCSDLHPTGGLGFADIGDVDAALGADPAAEATGPGADAGRTSVPLSGGDGHCRSDEMPAQLFRRSFEDVSGSIQRMGRHWERPAAWRLKGVRFHVRRTGNPQLVLDLAIVGLELIVSE